MATTKKKGTKKTTLKRFTIDRERWGRGGMGFESTALLNTADGRMCCLGFAALACGISRNKIEDIGTWEDLDEKSLSKLPAWGCPTNDGLMRHNVAIVQDMVRANDDDTITSAQRESQLTKLFAKVGVTVKFVDSLKKAKKGAKKTVAAKRK